MRTIKVPPGIGDNIWLLMKLVNAHERFKFELPNGKPQRGHQIFELLPSVSTGAFYKPFLYKDVKRGNIYHQKKWWWQIKETSFYLSMNEHLEQGRRIEDFLPDLPVSYRLQYDVESCPDPKLPIGKKLIGLYGSSYSTTRKWGFWDEDQWLELARLLYTRDPAIHFVIIGAEWDLDLGRNLVRFLEQEQIPFTNTIGQSLGTVIKILCQLHYFFSFPSGLGVLAATVDCPVTMFYPPHLHLMMNAWADPEAISNHRYKGCQFCSPREIFDWVTTIYKI